MIALPPNCPLTPEQFARLPIEVQTSETMIWVKDFRNPDPETLDRIIADCNRAVLPALAPFYFRHAAAPAAPTHTHHATPKASPAFTHTAANHD
jgi:hypothetical protein